MHALVGILLSNKQTKPKNSKIAYKQKTKNEITIMMMMIMMMIIIIILVIITLYLLKYDRYAIFTSLLTRITSPGFQKDSTLYH